MTESSRVLRDKLAAAIQAGDAKDAAILVAQLSNMKLKLDISIKNEEQEQRNSEQEFSVRVHVEDRISDGCYFNLQVKSCDTIQDLKRKVMLKYNFPEEVQRWIVGKKIPDNENKLSQCGVKGPGHTLYLYLVTARSVGLSKQDYESKRQALQQGVMISNKHSQPASNSPVRRESPDPYWPAPLSPPETQSQNYSNNPSPVLASSPEFGLGEVDTGQNSYGAARQTSNRSLSSGSAMLQEMLNSPNLSSMAVSESQPNLATPDSGIGHWAADYESGAARLPSANKPRAPSSTPRSRSEKIGWECPLCTFINLPIRPGCEMCSGPRPSGYKIPSDYDMTPEEVLLLENDQRLEQLTREATPSDRLAMLSQQPDFFDQHEDQHFNELLNMHNNNVNPDNRWDASVNNQIMDGGFILVPEGSDWTKVQEMTFNPSTPFEVEARPHQNQHLRGQSSRKSLPVAAPPPLQQLQHIAQAAKRSSIANHVINYFSPNTAERESTDKTNS